MGDLPNLMEDPSGMVFEYLDEQEAEFLYEEVFVRQSYLQHGLTVCDGAVVVDAGANIGLFSLQCLREAKAVQVFAFEPIPVIYDILVRNMNSGEAVRRGLSPRPVVLRLALGADQDQAMFTYFGDNPGESTRNVEEREKQRCTLLADTEATSWRRTLAGATSGVKDVSAVVGAKVNATATRTRCVESILSEDKQEIVDRTAPLREGAIAHLPCESAPELAQEMTDARHKLELGREKARGNEDEEGEGAAEINNEGTDRSDDANMGQSFLCSAVPLSLALDQLEIASVDMLKVDVEGDELAVLQGISANDWPKIRQVALEVHDVDGRLAATIEILRSERAGAFDEVCWEAQTTSKVGGYVMVVPRALRMFLVFAKRRPKSAGPAGLAEPTATGLDGRTNALEGEGMEEVGLLGGAGDKSKESRRSDITAEASHCCCPISLTRSCNEKESYRDKQRAIDSR